MKEYQTSQKFYASSAEKRNCRLKDVPKFKKITNKRLNSAFTSVSEGSVDFSPICEASHANCNQDVAIRGVAELRLLICLFIVNIRHMLRFWYKLLSNQALFSILYALFGFRENKLERTSVVEASTDSNDYQTLLLEESSPETLLSSDIMPSKKMAEEAEISSANSLGAYELDSAMFTPMEAEFAANFLRNAQPEVFTSHNASQYRKLMDEITKYVIEDHCINTLLEDFDRSAQVISAKNRMLFLCFCIWIFGVLAVLFFTSDIHCPSTGRFPT